MLMNEDKLDEIDKLKQELTKERQINNKTKDYLLLLESKLVEFEKQKEIIQSLNTQIERLKKEISTKNDEINILKQDLESSKITENYILKLLDLRKNLDEI